MKTALMLILAAALTAPYVAAQAKTKDPTRPTTTTPARTAPPTQTTEIKGKWSGNWTPKGDVPHSITIELRQENGKVSGGFVTPMPMEFTKVSYIPRTGAILLEASDSAGKLYRIDGKIRGTELKGTVTIKDVVGEARLIKWYFPR